MKKENICRAITLYNNFLPANADEHSWKYCAFGIVDGIDISENLISSGHNVPDCIWDKQNELVSNLHGKYSAQQVYVLKYDFPDKEAEFWESDNEFPFLFFLRVQCGDNKDALWENIDSLENVLQFSEEIKAAIYLTFDNADLFIVLKSKLYEQGAGMIDSLYFNNNLSLNKEKPCSLKNSFTIFAINNDWVANDLDNSSDLRKSRIEEVFIKIIEKENGCIASIVQQLNEEKCTFVNADKVDISRNTLLGIDDDLISIKDISWFDFLKLYENNSGILCNSSPLYSENMAGVTTIIKTKLHDYSDYLRTNGLKIDKQDIVNSEKNLGKIYLEQVENLSQKLQAVEKQTSGFDGLKEVKLILNVLPKFAGEVFNDYVFFPVISPLNALLDLIEIQKDYIYDDYYFYEFLKGFSMYAQGSARADKLSAQMMEFNTKIYDIPCKLSAFYCAFIYNIKKALGVPKEGKDLHEYEFLTVPGMTRVVNVYELYPKISKELRLMRVEIPERSFYNMHDMMIMLSHEMAHYVGNKYRNRKERYDYIISSYAHIYISYIRHFLWINDIRIENYTEELLVSRAIKLIEVALERETDSKFINDIKLENISDLHYARVLEGNEYYKCHFSDLLNNIDSTMTDIVQYGLDNIFSPIFYELSVSERDDKKSLIRSVSEKFIYKGVVENSLLSSESVLDILKTLYEECFADLMAFLILDLTVKDYIESVINNARQQGMTIEELKNSEIMYRVGVVLLCVVSCEVKGYNTKNVLNSFGDEDKTSKEVVEHAIRRWAPILFSDEELYKYEDYSKRSFYVYKDSYVLKQVYHYLRECCKKYLSDNIIEERRKENIKQIYNTFSRNTNENIVMQIELMVNFIECYREESLLELDGKIKHSNM